MSRRRRRRRAGASALPALLMIASPFLYLHLSGLPAARAVSSDPRLPAGLAWADFRPVAPEASRDDAPRAPRSRPEAEFGWMESMVGPVDRTERLGRAKEGVSIELHEALVNALVRMATEGPGRDGRGEPAPRDAWGRGGWAVGGGAFSPSGETEGLSGGLVDRALGDPAVGELLQRVVARRGRLQQEERWR